MCFHDQTFIIMSKVIITTSEGFSKSPPNNPQSLTVSTVHHALIVKIKHLLLSHQKLYITNIKDTTLFLYTYVAVSAMF